jgi:A/G-specific adenine glycosylase
MDKTESEEFIARVWSYYRAHQRQLPWRGINKCSLRVRGYRVVVSELMLQQTQVTRVVDKYNLWMQQWPTIDSFISASFVDVLSAWSGLGYNRRAKYIFDSLHTIHDMFKGIVPADTTTLTKLPGIGINTAGAIVVYTYNLPVVFIETNIRTVFLHEWYQQATTKVPDSLLLEKVADTIDVDNPRAWYYALMDYGTFIKRLHGSQLSKSASYKKQPMFKGSKREVRGRVVALLLRNSVMTLNELAANIPDRRLSNVLNELQKDGLLKQHKNGAFSVAYR